MADPIDAADDVRARRGAALAVPPLGLLACAFLLPTLRACDDVWTPLAYIRDTPLATIWVAPPYVGAALLFACTLVPLIATRRATVGEERVAGAALGMNLVAAGTSLVTFTFVDGPPVGFVAWQVLCISSALFLFVRSMRASGWRRWIRWLASFAGLALANGVTSLLIATAMYHREDIFAGGYLALGSMFGLALACAYGIDGPRAKPPPRIESA